MKTQNSATCVATPTSVEEADANWMHWKPHGVVLDQTKHSQDEMDRHAQRSAALHPMLGNIKVKEQDEASSHLSVERIVMKSGNGIIDQFQPWYVGADFLSCAAIVLACLICFIS